MLKKQEERQKTNETEPSSVKFIVFRIRMMTDKKKNKKKNKKKWY